MIIGKWMRRGEEVARELLLAKEQVEKLYSEYNERNEKLSSVYTEAMLLMSLKVEELYAFRNEHANETAQCSANVGKHKTSTPDNGVRRISSSCSPKKRKKDTLSKEKRLSRSDSLIGANATSDADGNNKTMLITKLIEAVNKMDDKRRLRVTAALNACFHYTRQSSTYEMNKQEGNVNAGANANAIIETSAYRMSVLSNVDKGKKTRNLSEKLINKTISTSPLTSPQRSNGNSPRNAPFSLDTETATTTAGTTSAQETHTKGTGELGENVEVDNITENRNSVDIISMTESSNVKSNTATKEFRRPREVSREVWNDMLDLREQKLKLEDSIVHILHALKLQIARFELLQKNLRVIEYAQIALVCDNYHHHKVDKALKIEPLEQSK